MGRPSDYTQEIADAICERIADGESLRSICDDDAFPNKATVFRWLANNEPFRDQYAHARDTQADTIAEDTIDIADDGRNDWMERNDPKNPGYDFNGEHVARSRLRVDARKWFASKVAPKKYGDKIDVTQAHSGKIEIEHVGVRDEIAGRIARIAQRTGSNDDPVEPDGSTAS